MCDNYYVVKLENWWSTEGRFQYPRIDILRHALDYIQAPASKGIIKTENMSYPMTCFLRGGKTKIQWANELRISEVCFSKYVIVVKKLLNIWRYKYD